MGFIRFARAHMLRRSTSFRRQLKKRKDAGSADAASSCTERVGDVHLLLNKRPAYFR